MLPTSVAATRERHSVGLAETAGRGLGSVGAETHRGRRPVAPRGKAWRRACVGTRRRPSVPGTDDWPGLAPAPELGTAARGHACSRTSPAHANVSAGHFAERPEPGALRMRMQAALPRPVHAAGTPTDPLQHREGSRRSGLKAAQWKRHEPRLNTSAHTHSIRIPA